jgi:hypothetical protein
MNSALQYCPLTLQFSKAGMAGEPYTANGNSRYETQFRNESCHNSVIGKWQLPISNYQLPGT